MKIHIFTVLSIVFVISCKSNKTIQGNEKMRNESPVLISSGNLYGSGEEGIEKQNLVITNDDDWNDLLKQMNSINKVSSSFSETEVDFSKYNVIAVFEDVKASGGYSIELDIHKTSEHTIINIINNTPEGLATSVMTQPYYIAKIPKTDMPIVFK